ncbi:DNA topoisomerase IB [soil metagenome]
MPPVPHSTAESAGLRYVTDAGPGITRIKSGRGFRYVDTNGEPLRDKTTLERIKAIVIPPAWTDVWISPSPNGHLQATGRDDRGRKQYRYHTRWRVTRDENKFDRLLEFGRALPGIREHVRDDLRKHNLPREKILATIVRLLETTYIRIGNETYARENDSFGLTTLHDKHVQVDGNTLRFHFNGKSGKEHRFAINDPRVSKIVKRSRNLPGQTLFQYEGDDGETGEIESTDVNAYLHAITGQDFTAKEFRTWAGTVLAVAELRYLDPPETEAEANREIVTAIDAVAGCLSNTRAVCRTSYIHPAVLDAYKDGSLKVHSNKAKRWKPGSDTDLDQTERLVLTLLDP